MEVSGDPCESPGKSDFLLRLGIYADGTLRWLGPEEVVDAGDPPSENHWRVVEAPLPEELAGQRVGVVLQAACGGPKRIANEECFVDRILVVEHNPR